MTFVSTAFDGETLTGDLTIKDVTKPVTLDVEFNGVATDPWGNEKAGFEATADINRTDWGLTWNANLEKGGVLVSEKIKLVLDVQLAKQA
jgi:polyisoprenoid-binding protein YceI